jgi:flagellar motor switch protein FliN
MNADPETRVGQGRDDLRPLAESWAETTAIVLETMANQKPEVSWQVVSGAASEISLISGDMLWWEQPFRGLPMMPVWVGTPADTWEFAGALTLKASGIDAVEPDEARSTWLEVLGQSLGAIASGITAVLGHEVTCDQGNEAAAEDNVRQWATLVMKFGEHECPALVAGFSPALIEALAAARRTQPAEAPAAPVRAAEAAAGPEPEPEPLRTRTMDLLLDVDLPVTISFGKAHLPIKDVLKLTTGSIVELNRNVDDPVEVRVNHCLIARGEVVVVDGNYGVRIQEIANRRDRIRSVR